MERLVRVFKSYEEAARADRAELAAMSPQERLDQAFLVQALQAHYGEAFGERCRKSLASNHSELSAGSAAADAVEQLG